MDTKSKFSNNNKIYISTYSNSSTDSKRVYFVVVIDQKRAAEEEKKIETSLPFINYGLRSILRQI